MNLEVFEALLRDRDRRVRRDERHKVADSIYRGLASEPSGSEAARKALLVVADVLRDS